MSYFMIGGDQREYGPVDAEVIRQWLKEGRANGETLLRAGGDTLWKPLRSFADFSADLPEASGPTTPPPAATAPISSGVVPAEIPVRIGSAFSRACGLLGQKFGIIAGATLIVWLVLSLLMWVPFCGPLMLAALEGPLYGGYFLLFLALIRGTEVSPGDVLGLAKDSFLPLATASLAINLLTWIGVACCIVPGIYLAIAWLLAFPLIADKKVDMWTGMEWSRQIVTKRWFHFLALFIVAFLPALIFHLIMTGVITGEKMRLMSEIIAERGEPQTLQAVLALAEELEKQMREVAVNYSWMWFARQFILLLTLPLGFATFAYVYEDIFGRGAARQGA